VTTNIVRVFTGGIGSQGRVTISIDPITTKTFDRRGDGSWYAWWMSVYGNGYGLQEPEEADPELSAELEAAWLEARGKK